MERRGRMRGFGDRIGRGRLGSRSHTQCDEETRAIVVP